MIRIYPPPSTKSLLMNCPIMIGEVRPLRSKLPVNPTDARSIKAVMASQWKNFSFLIFQFAPNDQMGLRRYLSLTPNKFDLSIRKLPLTVYRLSYVYTPDK